MSTITDPKVRQAIEACLSNADDLLRASKGAIERDQLSRIGFHLAALALEEVGKANLHRLLSKDYGNSLEPPSILVSALQDRTHVKRMFWAIFSGVLGQRVVNRKEIERLRGMARDIHETRLRGLYVDVNEEGVLVPSTAVTPEDATTLLNMASSRLVAERLLSFESRDMTAQEQDVLKWFMGATEDSEREKLIFSDESMKKLAELGDTTPWVNWLKERWDRDQAQMHALLEREINRHSQTEEDKAVDKWKMRVRFFTDSHSIRQTELNWWNDIVSWIKLNAANRSDELLVDFTAPKSIHVNQLYLGGWSTTRRFAAALNIASRGFFWWYLPEHVDGYFESLKDLESGATVEMARQPSLRVKRGRREVLDKKALDRTMLCMNMLSALQRHEHSPFGGAARKVDQYAARKVIQSEGGSFYVLLL